MMLEFIYKHISNTDLLPLPKRTIVSKFAAIPVTRIRTYSHLQTVNENFSPTLKGNSYYNINFNNFIILNKSLINLNNNL